MTNISTHLVGDFGLRSFNNLIEFQPDAPEYDSIFSEEITDIDGNITSIIQWNNIRREVRLRTISYQEDDDGAITVVTVTNNLTNGVRTFELHENGYTKTTTRR